MTRVHHRDPATDTRNGAAIRARRRQPSLWIPSILLVLTSLFVGLQRGLSAPPTAAVDVASPSADAQARVERVDPRALEGDIVGRGDASEVGLTGTVVPDGPKGIGQ